MSDNLIEVSNLRKSYGQGDSRVDVLKGIDCNIKKGSICSLLGPSGSGKSTFLNILGGIESFEEGSLIVDGLELKNLSKKDLLQYRRDKLGFVFQFYNLISNLTVLENVELAGQIVKESLNPAGVLERGELSHRLKNFPSQLSGGEQQRVAIARALCKNPKLLLCDEPTGALDYHTGKRILELLHQRCKSTNTTVILITHNQAIAPMADRVIEINDSTVKNVILNKNPKDIKEIEW